MKKFYLLALSLLSFAAASAQTLTVYHGETKVNNNDIIKITAPTVEDYGTNGVKFTFDGDITVKGSEDGKMTYTATRKADFEGLDIYSFSVCPDDCKYLTSDIESIIDNFNYYSKSFDDGKMPLYIHYDSGFRHNIDASDVPVGYANVEFEVYYTANPTDKVTFTVIFDNDPSHAAVNTITVDNTNAPVEYFNLNGTRVSADNLTPGLYIRRQGTTATKHLVK